jgi:hypothetical protein
MCRTSDIGVRRDPFKPTRINFVKMHVCKRALTIFQLAELHDVDPTIFTNWQCGGC